MRRALAPLTALVTLLGVAMAPACGFPDLSYSSDAGESTGDAHDATSQADGAGEDAAHDGMSGDASRDGESETSVDAGDGASAADSSTPMHDASFDSGDPCDVDGDGYRAISCGGNDCCDIDPAANPGVSAAQWFPSPDQCGNYNHRCGPIAMEYPVNLVCSGTGLLGCSPTGLAYTGDPGCGMTAELSECKGSGALACSPSPVMSALQGCN